MDDITDIQALYNGNPEKENERLQKHQLEYELTLLYFEQYLPAKGSVLEIGASTGNYTEVLASKGYTVTAFDLSEKCIGI